MEENNQEKDKVKIGYGKFTFEMSGDFVKENGKILAVGTVACGIIFTYAVTKNGEVTGNVIKLIQKSA